MCLIVEYVYYLPLEFRNSQHAVTMLKKVGRVLEIEEPIHEAKIIRNFILGARVMLDVTKPFPVGRWIPRVDLIKI